MIEAVIFDMDGLLVDSEPVWYRARKDLLETYDKVWSEIIADNSRGRRAHGRLGFRDEGLLREQVLKGGRHLDVVRVGLLAEEFMAQRDDLRRQLKMG